MAPLPSLEERRAAHEPVPLSTEARRLHWTLDGPLETAVMVMEHTMFDPADRLEPYCQRGPDGTPTWHAIAHSSLTQQNPVSSVAVRVRPLDNWEYDWAWTHHAHSDVSDVYDPAVVLWGPLPDPEGEDEMADADEPHLLVCCRTRRPRRKGVDMLVTATGDYVTIHDMLTKLHPYLLTRRADILEAMGQDQARDDWNGPVPADTKLMAYWQDARNLTVTDEANWLRVCQKQTPLHIPRGSSSNGIEWDGTRPRFTSGR